MLSLKEFWFVFSDSPLLCGSSGGGESGGGGRNSILIGLPSDLSLSTLRNSEGNGTKSNESCIERINLNHRVIPPLLIINICLACSFLFHYKNELPDEWLRLEILFPEE